MCNSARDILICMLSDTIHAYAIQFWGLQRKFKEIGQNLRKFGSSKMEFQFQAVETLRLACRYGYYAHVLISTAVILESFAGLEYLRSFNMQFNLSMKPAVLPKIGLPVT